MDNRDISVKKCLMMILKKNIIYKIYNKYIFYTMMNSNIQYDITIMYGFTLVGIIIKLFFAGDVSLDGTSGPASTNIWGYGTMFLSLIGILLISFSFASKQKELGIMDFVKRLMSTSAPILVTMILLIWILTISSIYYTKINTGQIATEYYQYSNISTFLIMTQIVLLFMSLREDEVPNKFSYATYFFTLLNAIFIGITNIILTFFSTDG